jgi:hypothetical protein
MQWLNLNSETLDSEEFVGSEPVDRATWLCLLRYCAGQENGGRIRDCKAWADRKWQQLCRVTKTEIERASKLWKWKGDDLIVFAYPSDQEAVILAKREGGRVGGLKSAQTRRKTEVVSEAQTKDEASSPPSIASNELQAGDQRKGREGKGREGKGSTHAYPARAKRLHGIPETVDEVVAYGRTINPPVSESKCRNFWAHYEGQAGTNPNGDIFWKTSGDAVVTKWKVKLPQFEDKQHGNNQRNNRQGDRNAGTANEGRAGQYAGIGKVQS